MISYLTALASFAKDFHYYCKSFGKHLFMDEVYDNLYEYTDEIRENVILCSGELPYSSRRYLSAAAELVPQINEDDEKLNLEMLKELLEVGKARVNVIEGTSRGQNALLDDIAGHLDKMIGLTFLQLRKYGEPVAEAKVEHCKACTEKAIDRAEAILADIDRDKVAKTVLDYEAQNVLVAEESALDKLSKKLGV